MKKRLTGFSIAAGPIGGGLSWEYTSNPQDIISGLFTFLEARRLLTNPSEMEVVDHCKKSAMAIKQYLVATTQKLLSIKASKDVDLLNTLIDACNQFLNDLGSEDRTRLIYKADGNTWEDKDFDKAMKGFRASVRSVIEALEKDHKLKFRKEIPYQF